MEKEFTAKTIEEARALAADEFGVSEDEIDFEILEQPRKTIFGSVKGEARVKAVYEPEKEPVHERIYAGEDDEDDYESASDSGSAEDADEEFGAAGQPALPEGFDPNGSVKVKTAIEYLSAVMRQLGMDEFVITPKISGGMVVLDISGEKLGIVIGKRGETLDALQYLTILASNRTEENFCKISLDCNGYRDKRHEALTALAKKTSAKVIKQGRKIALEPMNPYERRIIHSCVSEIEGVSSRSTGSEPYRKVVIYADKPKFEGRRKGGRGDRARSGPEGGSRNYRRSTGFSTSFEREYKRSSYSPDENADAGEFSKDTVDFEKSAGLYGKIEL